MTHLSPSCAVTSLLGLLLATCSGAQTTRPTTDLYLQRPHLALGTDAFRVVILLPDSAAGHYRGPRFVHGGIVAQISLQSPSGPRTFCAQVTDRDDPTHFDANANGLMEEFSTPLGFDEAQPTPENPAPEFVKVGVGVLARTTTQPYRFSRPYPIVQAPSWAVVREESAISFTQSLNHTSGFGYLYSVRVAIDAIACSIRIERTLSNIGTRDILTHHYSHHFFALHPAGTAAGAGYSLTFPGEVSLKPDSTLATTSKVDASDGITRIKLSLPVPAAKSVWSELTAPDNQAYRNFSLSFTEPRSEVMFHAESPIDSALVWISPRVFCPETFTNIALPPGGQMKWSSQYIFGAQ